MSCPINKSTKTLKLVEDRVSGGGPGKGALVEVMVRNVLVDLSHQFAHAAKRAAPERVLGDDPNQCSTWLSQLESAGVYMDVIAPVAGQPGFPTRIEKPPLAAVNRIRPPCLHSRR
jgi:hypothetical protein